MGVVGKEIFADAPYAVGQCSPFKYHPLAHCCVNPFTHEGQRNLFVVALVTDSHCEWTNLLAIRLQKIFWQCCM